MRILYVYHDQTARSATSDLDLKSSLSTQWVAKDQSFLHAAADAQADLSLRWAHIPFCWFCHVAAQLFFMVPFMAR